MREKKPYTTAQMSMVRYFKDSNEVAEWIDELLEVHEGAGDAYYRHVDHFIVLPFPAHSEGILALTIYHTVYLEPGE